MYSRQYKDTGICSSHAIETIAALLLAAASATLRDMHDYNQARVSA